jgi:hypothetical protein
VKGALRLLLLLGFAAIGLFFLRAAPRSVTLVYDLGEAVDVRALEVEVRGGEGALRRAEFRFPGGAPRQVVQEVKLPDGSYQVVVRVSGTNGPVRRRVLPIVVSEGGPIVLAIRDPAPRAD